jgi:hypothetical protein
MGDFPFTARDMTAVHWMFISGAQAALHERRRAAAPGAAKRMNIRASNGAHLDRAFAAMQQARRPRQ